MPNGLLSGHIIFIQADTAAAQLSIDKWHCLFSAVIVRIFLCFVEHCIYRSGGSSRLGLFVSLVAIL